MSIPRDDAFGRAGTRGKGNQARGRHRWLDLSVSSLLACSGRHLTYPFFFSPQSFALGLAGTCLFSFLFLFLRCITDIDDPNYCNEPLYNTPHTPHTYIAYLPFTSYYT